jgi:hypothetical protein
VGRTESGNQDLTEASNRQLQINAFILKLGNRRASQQNPEAEERKRSKRKETRNSTLPVHGYANG